MVPANSRIQGFNDLRGSWIGVLYGDEGARDRAQAWADSINASVNFIQTPEASAALTILEYDNADVVYANSLALIPHLEASPSALRLTDRWYSREYYGMAMQHNDIDFSRACRLHHSGAYPRWHAAAPRGATVAFG